MLGKATFFLFVLLSLKVQAGVILAFDIDNTILRNSNMLMDGVRGTFDIPMVVVRTSRPSNLLYATNFPTSTDDLLKELSVYDFETLKKQNRFARNNGTRGDVLGEKANIPYKLLDGTEFYPGYYKIVPEITYQNYGNDQMFLDKFEEVFHSKLGKKGWSAFGYEQFKFIMNHETLHKAFRGYTARSNRISAFVKWSERLVELGEIKYAFEPHQIYAVNSIDGWSSGQPYHSTARQKANLLYRDMIRASRFRHNDESTYVKMNNELGPNHVVYFFDDDPNYLEEVVKYIKGASSGPANNVKFVYYNLGFYPDEKLLDIATRSQNRIEKTYRYKPGIYTMERGVFKPITSAREMLAEGQLNDKEIAYIEKINQQIFKDKNCSGLF